MLGPILVIIGIATGVALGLYVPYANSDMSPYIAVAILAALDSVFGGVTAYLRREFKITIFLTGFFANAFLASFLTYLGGKLGISFYMAAVLVFGARVFNNFTFIRRAVLKRREPEDESSKIADILPGSEN